MRQSDTAVFVCTNILTEKTKQHHAGKGDAANQSTSKHTDITVKTHFEKYSHFSHFFKKWKFQKSYDLLKGTWLVSGRTWPQENKHPVSFHLLIFTVRSNP